MEEKVKVFLSWSGKLSHKVAAAFADWLPDVIQNVDTYLSSEDIEKGAAWYSEIIENLKGSAIGVIFLTKDNINRPWIYFESGAIAGNFEKKRVCPLLIGIDENDVKDTPLSNHMCTKYEKDEIRKLLHSINNAKKEGPVLDETRLDRAYDKCWDELNDKVSQIIEEFEASEDESIEDEKELAITEKQPEIQEILERVQYIHRILSDPETLFTEPLREAMRSTTPRILGAPCLFEGDDATPLPLPDYSFKIESGSPADIIRRLWNIGSLMGKHPLASNPESENLQSDKEIDQEEEKR